MLLPHLTSLKAPDNGHARWECKTANNRNAKPSTFTFFEIASNIFLDETWTANRLAANTSVSTTVTKSMFPFSYKRVSYFSGSVISRSVISKSVIALRIATIALTSTSWLIYNDSYLSCHFKLFLGEEWFFDEQKTNEKDADHIVVSQPGVNDLTQIGTIINFIIDAKNRTPIRTFSLINLINFHTVSFV